MRESFNIILAGVGGQGVILSSTIIGEAAVEDGLRVRIAEFQGAGREGWHRYEPHKDWEGDPFAADTEGQGRRGGGLRAHGVPEAL